MPAASIPYNPCEILLLKALITKTFRNGESLELRNDDYDGLAVAINYAGQKSGISDKVGGEYLKKIIGNGANLKFKLSKKIYSLLTIYVNTSHDNFNFNDFYTGLCNESIVSVNDGKKWQNAKSHEKEVEKIKTWSLEKIRDQFYSKARNSHTTSPDLKGAQFINYDFTRGIRQKPRNSHKPIDFYTAKRDNDCQWFGILENWDVERTGYENFKQGVLNSFNNEINSRVVGLVYGPGGSGKSTLLRRLAIDMAKEEFRTIWVSNINDFLVNDFDTIFEETARYLIIIEDWYQLAMDDKISNPFLQKLNGFKNVRIVIGDRDITGKFYKKFLYGQNTLCLSSEDNLTVLNKLKTLEPRWADTIYRLTSHAASTSLYLLLFVFAHLETNKDDSYTKIDVNDIMADFREIVQSDLKKINLLYPGIAKAMFYWANVYKAHKIKISRAAFLAIANHYQDDLNRDLQLSNNTNIGQQVFKYIYFDKSEERKLKNSHTDLLNFNQDLLAEEGLANALLEGFDAYDDNDKRSIMNAVIGCNEPYSSSVLFDIFYRNERQIFLNNEEIKEIFYTLFNQQNNQHHYFATMLSFNFFTNDEKLSFIKRAADFFDTTNSVWGKATFWIDSVYTKLERKDIFHFLFSKRTNTKIWNSYRKILEPGALIRLAFNLLDQYCSSGKVDQTISFPIICNCLTLTNDKKSAGVILEIYCGREKLDQTISSQIICICLTITGDKKAAREILEIYCGREKLDQTISPDIICNCLTLTNDKKLAKKILGIYCGREKLDQTISPSIICNCLTLTSDKKLAEKILGIYCGREKLDQTIAVEIVCICLTLTGDKNAAKKILEIYCGEEKLDQTISPDIICNCLTLTSDKKLAEKILGIYCGREKLDQTIAVEMACICLTLTGDKNAAKKILEIYCGEEKLDQTITYQIVSTCLTLTKDKKSAENIFEKYFLGEKIKSEILSPAIRVFYNCVDYEIIIQNILVKSISTNHFTTTWNSISVLNSINPVNKELQKVVSKFFSDFSTNYKDHHFLNPYSQLLKIPLTENKDWNNAVNFIGRNYLYLHRKIVFGYLIGQKKNVEKIEPVCKYFIEYWQREIDLQRQKRTPYWQHIILSFQHPALKELAKETAPMLYTYIVENNIQFLDDNMKTLEEIVKNGIIRPWPIKEDLINDPIEDEI